MFCDLVVLVLLAVRGRSTSEHNDSKQPSKQANKQTSYGNTNTETNKQTHTRTRTHVFALKQQKAAHYSGLQKFSDLTDMCCKTSSTMQSLLACDVGSTAEEKEASMCNLACLSVEKIFSQLLHNSKKQSDQRIIAQFLDALLQKDSEKADFFAKDVVGHAKTVHPLFDPNGCSIHDLQDALQALCSNILVDEDDPVNVDDEGRPVVRLMGSTNGPKIVEAARAIFKNRRTELTMAESLNSIEESLKKMQALDETCCSLSEQKESMLEVHNSLPKMVAMKEKPALIQQRHDVLQKEWTEHLANVQMWDLYSVAGVGLKRVLGSELGDGDEEIDAEEAK